MANIDKLNALASKDSKWLKEAEERQENKNWLRHSQKIAIKVLRTIRELGMTQKELAAKMGVSAQMVNKMVKGKENFTLQTIAKLEEALEVYLIFTENNRAIFAKEYVIKEQLVYLNTYKRNVDLGTHKLSYKKTKKYPKLRINEFNTNTAHAS